MSSISNSPNSTPLGQDPFLHYDYRLVQWPAPHDSQLASQVERGLIIFYQSCTAYGEEENRPPSLLENSFGGKLGKVTALQWYSTDQQERGSRHRFFHDDVPIVFDGQYAQDIFRLWVLKGGGSSNEEEGTGRAFYNVVYEQCMSVIEKFVPYVEAKKRQAALPASRSPLQPHLASLCKETFAACAVEELLPAASKFWTLATLLNQRLPDDVRVQTFIPATT